MGENPARLVQRQASIYQPGRARSAGPEASARLVNSTIMSTLLHTVAEGPPLQEKLVIPVGGVLLRADVEIPPGARGLVVFAHGSGSSRKSARNQFVAGCLRERGLGTLLFDLLTAAEERRDAIDAQLRFDIPFLASRLRDVTDWAQQHETTRNLVIGYFGASTGAAAALIASAELPELSAVVCRGGRPDLAKDAVNRVRAPTLLIVGGDDASVLSLNRAAFEQLTGIKKLEIVAGATHLFEEPRALEQVAALAGDWFVKYLGAS